MNYMRIYPTERQLLKLAYGLPFPMTAGEIAAAARDAGCPPATLRLLRLFDTDDVFENGADFINRCEEVQLLADEKRRAPKELLHTPQDS